jgi:hypothetical protein
MGPLHPPKPIDWNNYEDSMSKFEQRHYEMVAQVLSACREMCPGSYEIIVQKFANHFEQDNSKFKRRLFKRACGLTPDKPMGPSLASVDPNSHHRKTIEAVAGHITGLVFDRLLGPGPDAQP